MLLVCVCVPNACVHACERLYVYTLCVLERVYGGGREWGGGEGYSQIHSRSVSVMSLTSVVQFDYAFSDYCFPSVPGAERYRAL